MNSESLPVKIILASSSIYRKKLLQRLGMAFDCQSPGIEESPKNGEATEDLVVRLASEKASWVSARQPAAIVIGSDQVAVFEGRVIGKPGSHALAREQLSSCSGRVVEFLTAVAVQCASSGFNESHTNRTQVRFRELGDQEIDRYLRKEQPYDCAGAFKAESLGITLFEEISSNDPTALVGLPLIQTSAMLRRAGLQLP